MTARVLVWSLEFAGDAPELILKRADPALIVRNGIAATRVVADAAKNGFRIGRPDAESLRVLTAGLAFDLTLCLKRSL